MKVLVRADANLEIGSGHVMRCAALGAKLKASGASVHFVSSNLPSGLEHWLIDNFFGLTVIVSDHITDWHADYVATSEVIQTIGEVDLLIVDHYHLDQKWESKMRRHAKRILVIDDLANRDHDCDFLLDQNLHENAQHRYLNRVPINTKLFLGPQYACLRKEFEDESLSLVREGNVTRLLVFFGGTDPGNQTLKVVNALLSLGIAAPICTVVLGPANPFGKEIHREVVGSRNIKVLDATDNMATLMHQADLAIGTCGLAAWERCVLGLPSLVVITAENQREDAEILARLGAVENLGNADLLRSENWEIAIKRAIQNPNRIRNMSIASREVMFGRAEACASFQRALLGVS
jgi:UDP-2,4-diacetamido-2,4,6-trideoxy-beta-L-altropyranose hydrolase